MGGQDIGPRPARASDADRERTIRALRERSIEGSLSHDTFIRRVDQALRAKNRDELDDLVDDLEPPGRLLRRVTGMVAALSDSTARLRAAWLTPRMPRLRLPSDGRDRLTIGRTPECDFVLADPTVSRHHAELWRRGDGWLLVDLGSTNGTRLNGWRLTEPVPIRPGDDVAFARVRFRFSGR
jgi:hypothetical protein